MTQTKYQMLVTENERQHQEARRVTVDWILEHAGTYRSQAHKALQNKGSRRRWSRENLTIELSRLPNANKAGASLKCELYSVQLQAPPGSGQGYYAYASITEMPLDREQFPEAPAMYRNICVTCRYSSDPDNAGYPWSQENTGLDGLRDRYVQLTAAHAKPPEQDAAGGGAKRLAALFHTGDGTYRETVIALTLAGAAERELKALAQQHATWAHTVRLDHELLVETAKELPHEDIANWVTRKLNVLVRAPQPGATPRLALSTDSVAEAARYLESKSRQRASDALDETHLTTLKLLETAFISLELAFKKQETARAGNQSQVQKMQQTVDQLKAEQNALRQECDELRSQRDSYRAALTLPTTDEGAGKPGAEPAQHGWETPRQRQMSVSDAATRPGEYDSLTFLENALEPLSDYARPRPRSEEITAALSALNLLAQAYRNTPNGKIGLWHKYFIYLTGWKYAPQEKAATMSRFGERRQFRNGAAGSRVTMTRHLTYTGSHGGLQIYFAPGEGNGPFQVGYIGEHLPYASEQQ